MTVDEFIAKYNNKDCEVGGSSNAVNQCVDLANAYIMEVLGRPQILWTNADDFPSKCTDFCDWIPYIKGLIPPEGSLIIWELADTGHIALSTEDADTNRFKSFDQNWPVGSKCHLQEHNYNNVIGWLHPKGLDVSCEKDLSDCQTNLDIKVRERDSLTKKLGDCETNLSVKVKERDKLLTENAQLRAQIDSIKLENEVEKDQIKKTCDISIQKLTDQNIEMVNKYNALKEAVSNLSWKEIFQLIINKLKG